MEELQAKNRAANHKAITDALVAAVFAKSKYIEDKENEIKEEHQEEYQEESPADDESGKKAGGSS